MSTRAERLARLAWDTPRLIAEAERLIADLERRDVVAAVELWGVLREGTTSGDDADARIACFSVFDEIEGYPDEPKEMGGTYVRPPR